MARNENEISYYAKTNAWFLFGIGAHIPLAWLVAYLNNTSLVFASLAGLLILSMPTVLFFRDREAKETSIALAVALVSFSALLIHLSNGMTEMHFHVFSALGIIIVLAQPLASLVALLVVAVHHVAFYFFLPASLVNYEAGFHILVIHALFAIATGVPAMMIASKFKSYVVSIREIVENADAVGCQIAQATLSISEASISLAASAEQESASLVQTTATIDTLTEFASKNLAIVIDVSQKSESSNAKSIKAQKAILDLCLAIRDVKMSSTAMSQAIMTSNDRLAEILRVIESISQKTSLINEIVFQTKLLSFNASIEAARAGEHGAGFAVVAQEVGNLSTVSGKSSTEISGLVEEGLRKVGAIISDTKAQVSALLLDSEQKVERSLVLSNECGSMLNEIAGETSVIFDAARMMSESNRQQVEGMLEISKAASNIEQVSTHNAELAQTASNAASELKQATADLSTTIDTLKVAIGTKKAA